MNRNYCTCFAVALIASLPQLANAGPQSTTVSILGSAETFAVLGGTTVTSTGLTVIDGDLGVNPGSAITGFPPGVVVNGLIYTGADPVALQAHADTITAFNFLAGETAGTNLSGQNLGGLILTSGVYKFDTSAALTGTLTLDTQGNPNAIFHFQIGTTFITDALSSVVTLGLGGAASPNIFWQIGSSATIAANTALQGTLIAQTTLTIADGVSIQGRALAIDGAVTLTNDNIANGVVPEPNSAGIVMLGLIMLLGLTLPPRLRRWKAGTSAGRLNDPPQAG